MNTPNIGPYASVVGDNQTPRRIIYNRGYGNIVSTTFNNNKVNTTATVYNRLQPLCGSFGKHTPMTADPGYIMPNSQTTIAWDNKQPVLDCVYQNVNIVNVSSEDSTLPEVE
jgi:hypothetical protein